MNYIQQLSVDRSQLKSMVSEVKVYLNICARQPGPQHAKDRGEHGEPICEPYPLARTTQEPVPTVTLNLLTTI